MQNQPPAALIPAYPMLRFAPIANTHDEIGAQQSVIKKCCNYNRIVSYDRNAPPLLKSSAIACII
jgi:hypothetical protein